jgi:hypothetical protein
METYGFHYCSENDSIHGAWQMFQALETKPLNWDSESWDQRFPSQWVYPRPIIVVHASHAKLVLKRPSLDSKSRQEIAVTCRAPDLLGICTRRPCRGWKRRRGIVFFNLRFCHTNEQRHLIDYSSRSILKKFTASVIPNGSVTWGENKLAATIYCSAL